MPPEGNAAVHTLHGGSLAAPAAVTAPRRSVTPRSTKEGTRRLARDVFVQAREAVGYSQSDVAAALDVSSSTVKAWESEAELTSKPVPLRVLFDGRLPEGLRAVVLAAVSAEARPGGAVCASTVAELSAALVALGTLIGGIGADLADGRVTPAEASVRIVDVLRAQRALDSALRALVATAGAK